MAAEDATYKTAIKTNGMVKGKYAEGSTGKEEGRREIGNRKRYAYKWRGGYSALARNMTVNSGDEPDAPKVYT